MRRSLAIILWILIGALASGASIGWVLRSANHDRETLARSLGNAKEHIKSLEKLNQETSQSLSLTAQEVGRLQSELATLQSWQRILKNATPLTPPPPIRLRGWSEFASVPMGAAIRVPSGSQARTNDDGLFLRTQPKPGQQGIEEQWLVLVKYNQNREKEFYKNSSYDTSGPVSYSLDNRLISGSRTYAGTGSTRTHETTSFILSVQDNATSTYLVWAKTVPGIDERTILDTLATLSFR